MGAGGARQAVVVARDLRAANLNVEMLSPERKMKALLARASKIGARFAVIIGDDELARGVVQLRDLKHSTQREVASRRSWPARSRTLATSECFLRVLLGLMGTGILRPTARIEL